MPDVPRDQKQDRMQIRALIIALAWMIAVQLACIFLWDAGWLTRQGALLHWLLIGVLAPALALWTSGAPASTP